ncbi:MAG: CxxxxCH/CxxCH domain-containing protein, partial [Syntrophales bacterium]
MNIAVSEAISASTNYIIVYDITAGAIANGTSISFTGAVTALTPAAGTLADAGATITLLATTTLGNATEPATARLWKSSAATNMDAFTLQHNGTVATDDDTISNVTVTLAPQYISGGSGGTVSKIKLMEIVDSTGTIVYGSVNLPTTGDTWNIPLTGMTATPTPATYYVRVSTADVITPSVTDTSGTPDGYYVFNGTITSYVHSKPNNKPVNTDSASQSLVIDVEKPIGPATANAVTGVNNGEIDLTWASGSDPNGGSLNAVTPYVIMRSAPEGGVPNPGCIDGTNLATVPGVTINYAARSVTDKGLVDIQATQYQYRICSKDTLGNLSTGATALATAKVNSVCTNPPSINLIPDSQIVKSTGTPFTLQIANTDTGTCPDVVFSLALANEAGSITHFDKSFPATVTLGTGGAGAPTGTTVPITITGRPEASQLEQYKFAITVTSPGNNHGLPQTTVQVTGILNDMPPIVHNSGNMAKYQYGNWGQTYTCATCHSNSTTNIKGVYTIISTPIGRRSVVFSKTSSVVADSDGVFSNDQRTVKNVSNNVCSVCHHSTRQHQYSANKIGAVVGPQGDELYNPDHYNSRDCVRCHTHNTAFRSIYGLCGDCHGFKNTGYSPINKTTMVKDLTNALGPAPPNYGAHQRHNIAKLTCAACHSNTNHGLETTAWLGDNKLEIGFTTSSDTFPGYNPAPAATKIGGTFYGTNNLNIPFTWMAGAGTTINQIADYNNSCNTYCHGTWSGNTGSQTQPIWVGGVTQVQCGSCHYATAAVPPTSGSHAKHAANTGAGLGIACSKCHATYASYTGSAHINGKVEWSMTNYPGALYKGYTAGSTNAPAPTATINYGQCTNLYCHSNIQNPTTGTGLPTTYATPVWGGTAACGSCHVYPNTTGSHASHENVDVAFDCHVCHNNGGTTAPLKHADGTIDFSFVGLAQNTTYSRGNAVAPGTAYGTCGTSDCHGRFTRAWGTPASGLPMCDKCHGSATSARGFYNTRGPDGTLSIYSTAIGMHDIHIQNPNSPRKATFARFTSYAASYKCVQCHNNPTGPFTAGHIDTSLPAEAPFSHISSISHKGDAFQ